MARKINSRAKLRPEGTSEDLPCISLRMYQENGGLQETGSSHASAINSPQEDYTNFIPKEALH